MVDKRLILAVAGSGKTKYIIDNINLDKKYLVVSYTNTSLNLIKSRIIKKFGYFPPNVKALTYFDFLYSFCVKPFIYRKYNLKGIYWETPPDFTNYLPNIDHKKYKTSNNYLYHNRIAKFIEVVNIEEDVIKRLEKFYDFFCFDEAQDLGGHDFNFILKLTRAKINFLFVGDFFQNTYTTSFDRNVNINLYNDLEVFIQRYKYYNIEVDVSTLEKSFRCSPNLCDFITKKIGINIQSNRLDETNIFEISDTDEILKIINNNSIVKLVYDKSSNKNYFSKNWGECKGEDDFQNTCILLNKTTYALYKKDRLNQLKPRTKNKLYVALSRTKGDCYLIEEKIAEEVILQNHPVVNP